MIRSLAALALDCGYYWFHRASHEVGVLWAVHQVHHSSQEFNLTTAFRQPLFQGLTSSFTPRLQVDRNIKTKL